MEIGRPRRRGPDAWGGGRAPVLTTRQHAVLCAVPASHQGPGILGGNCPVDGQPGVQPGTASDDGGCISRYSPSSSDGPPKPNALSFDFVSCELSRSQARPAASLNEMNVWNVA